ncbi:hypothetical protein EJ06DRAFT_524598 [Trichodelitschia bisporula]|uniref:Uncharacterized protein n=1 Tax=Trichodelitschia bisporula TaxID=703511 RepID=A0A6G1HL60_9PEZI|nr:hypothetical protein EJ06DRAFT_524598 [Trichodelitschia bisporula]
MTESLKCFTLLTENVPTWLSALTSLEARIAARQAELARLESSSPHKSPRRSSSNKSIRRRDRNSDATEPPSPSPGPSTPKKSSFLLRKRKPGSLLSATRGESKERKRGPAVADASASHISIGISEHYRSNRHGMVVVYYDSEVQSAFEVLVRYVGSGRAAIRKARMASRMEALYSGSTGLRPDASPDEVLAEADRQLEKAQAFCERGAHQFLRDGVSSAEIEGARSVFVEIQRLAGEQVERLKVEVKMRKQEEEEEEAEADTLIVKQDIKVSGGVLAAAVVEGGLQIEADDGEGDDDLEDALALLPPRLRYLLSGTDPPFSTPDPAQYNFVSPVGKTWRTDG